MSSIRIIQPKYLRLHPLTPSNLPYHPTLKNTPETSPNLLGFCKGVVEEGRQLIETELRNSFVREGKERASAPAKSLVGIRRWTRRYDGSLSVVDVPPSAVDGLASGVDNSSDGIGKDKKVVEYWFARSSEHKDPDPTWDDFVKGLYENHSENEAEYTPDVYDCREVCRWDVDEGEIGGMEGVTLRGVFFLSLCLPLTVVGFTFIMEQLLTTSQRLKCATNSPS